MWATRFGTWVILNIAATIDPILLRLSAGRFCSATMNGAPALLLTTTGARSGRPRSHALLYVRDGDSLVLVASAGGIPRNPGWYHNLKAHPQAQVVLGGCSRTYLAREATGDERTRLWAKLRELYEGIEAYKERAGSRQIPVMVLTPQADDAQPDSA